MKSSRIILGIDPGTNIMGYGLIEADDQSPALITLGVLKLGGYSNQALKLKIIFEKTQSLIGEYKPDELAIEAPFYGKNVQSMLKLGRAQGVAMAAALVRSIPIFEYSPRKIKQSITGRGNASKEQVAGMLARLFAMDEPPDYLDATDGLAVAVCHFYQGKLPSVKKNYSGWEGFLTKNPGRIITS